MNDLLYLKGIEKGVEMRNKSVKVNACSSLPLSHAISAEQEFIKWLE